MIHGYHLIFGAYGFWMPNDPRGSWSDFIRSWELLRFGPATKTDTRRSVARTEHDRQLRREAKKALRYPPVVFTGVQARAIGRGFAEAAKQSAYVIHACSIMPEHVHLIVSRHHQHVRRMIAHFKGRATMSLVEQELHPFLGMQPLPPCWGRNGWHVFLDSEEDKVRAIEYVEENPVKEGLPRQRWSFVRPYI